MDIAFIFIAIMASVTFVIYIFTLLVDIVEKYNRRLSFAVFMGFYIAFFITAAIFISNCIGF